MTITISAITVPAGKTISDDIDITFTTSVAIEAATVTLFLAGDPVLAIAAVPNGTTNTARVPAGRAAEATYDLEILVTDAGGDFGKDTSATLTIDDVTRVFTAYIELIRSVIKASPLLDDIDNIDIIVDNFDHRKADDRRPGIIIQRGPIRLAWTSVAKKRFDMTAHILVSTKANWRGEKDDPDRRTVEQLADSCRQALEADQFLGGLLYIPLDITEDIPSISRNQNDSNFYQVLEVVGSARRLISC